jgi:hypothetical protein
MVHVMHQAMTVVVVVVVLDAAGKAILETMVPTEAAAIIRLVQSLSAPQHMTFEGTAQAEWRPRSTTFRSSAASSKIASPTIWQHCLQKGFVTVSKDTILGFGNRKRCATESDMDTIGQLHHG